MSSLFGQGQQGGNFNPGMYQQYADAQQNPGNFDAFNHQDVFNHYQQYAQQVPPEQLYQSHQQYYQGVPQQQRQGILGGLLNAFGQQGISPQQAGMSPNDPSPENLARGHQYAAQNPDILSGVFGPGGALSSPLAKAALAGGLALAAKNFFGNGGFR